MIARHALRRTSGFAVIGFAVIGFAVMLVALSGIGASTRAASAQEAVPRPAIEAFDHLVLAVADLDQGIRAIAEKTGVVAAIGGSHPGRGTRNALLSLGSGHYLEIVAPDPAQPESKSGDAAEMARMKAPLLGGWALTSRDLPAELERIRARGLAMEGPFPGSRDRPDGSKLTWQTAFASGPLAQTLPFLIQWGDGSPHPSTDAPLLGQLVSLVIVHPEPETMRKALDQMGLACPVEKGETVALRARIVTPRGALDL